MFPEAVVSADRPTTAIIPLSSARVRLFQLVEELLSGKTQRVILSHRDRDDAVVLLTASELGKLERDLAALRAHANVGALRGLGTLHAPLEQVIRGVRARQESLAGDKRAEYGETAVPTRAVAEPKRAYRGRKKRT
jgi:hypothetical protein